MSDYEKRAFWTGQNWPSDAYGFEFLARAARRVGAHLFGDEWTGAEPFAPELLSFWRDFNGISLPLSGGRNGMAFRHREAMHRLISSQRPDLGRSPIIQYGVYGPQIPEFSQEEWNVAVELGRAENARRQPAILRWARVQGFLQAAMRDGHLGFALLPLRGGAFVEVSDKTWWNVRSVDHRFYFCQMNPFDPFGVGVAGDRYMHIFVSAADLTQVLANTAPAASAAVPMQPKSNEGYAAALALLDAWRPTKRTIRAFEAYCKERGISSLNARDAYSTLRTPRGRKSDREG